MASNIENVANDLLTISDEIHTQEEIIYEILAILNRKMASLSAYSEDEEV